MIPRQAQAIYPITRLTPLPAVTEPVVPECIHLGRSMPPPHGADTRRRCHRCNHPETPLGPIVCPCQGCGLDCTGYQPEEVTPRPVAAMHLLYHIYPRRDSIWRWRLAQILARWQQFTSHTITIGFDDTTESPATIADLLPPCTILPRPAASAAGETAHWHEGWAAVLAHAEPHDIILRAHAKGVTRGPWEYYHEWTDWLVHTCCDYPALVRRLLSTHPIAGPLLLQHTAPWNHAPHCDWHFAGSWYWVRADAARDRYPRIVPNRFGVESWPGMHFRRPQAGRLFRPAHGLHDPEAWSRVLTDWLRWTALHTAAPTIQIPILHFITPVTRALNDIEPRIAQLGIPCLWHRLPGEPGTWGGSARNQGIARITDPQALVYFLDDDTIPHPHLPGLIAAALQFAPQADGYILGQRRGGHILPGTVEVGGIDTGSLVWRRRALAGLHWANHYTADHAFIAQAIAQGRHLVHIPAVGSLYNHLRA